MGYVGGQVQVIRGLGPVEVSMMNGVEENMCMRGCKRWNEDVREG